MTSREHPVYRGGWAPVAEETTAFRLPVTGGLPTELDGRYLRIGPNPLNLDDPGLSIFLGEGMVHGVRIRDGHAEWYRNRWVRSAAVARALGEQPRPGPVHGHDVAANTHVVRHAGRTLALVEGGSTPYALDEELDTLGPCDFDGTLPGGFSGHPKRDPRTGELHAVAYYAGWRHVQYIVVAASGTVTRTVDIPVTDQPLMHDFALTGRYAVLYDLPVTRQNAQTAPGGVPFGWNPQHPARLGLLPRDGDATDILWAEIEPCWVFHTVNAYDDGDTVVIDVIRYPTLRSGRDGLTGEQPALYRWTVHVPTGVVSETCLDERSQEFPRVDEQLTSLPYRYAYTAYARDFAAQFTTEPELENLPGEAFGNVLLKHDLVTGQTEQHPFGRDAYVGEPTFIPAAPHHAEDDGYVMAYVNNPERGAADLVVLSARDFNSPPIAAIHLPTRVPLGFHGNWLPTDQPPNPSRIQRPHGDQITRRLTPDPFRMPKSRGS